MSGVVVEEFPNHFEARCKLATFLEQTWPSQIPGGWSARMAFWWDENPMAKGRNQHGLWALDQGQLIAFGGVIPASYAWQGEQIPALYGTTFCVAKSYRKAGMTLFLRQRQVMQDYLMAHTTPIPRIQSTLLKMGGHGETIVNRSFFLAGPLSNLKGRRWWPSLGDRKHLVTDLASVRSLVRPYQHYDRLEKWITVDSLRWFCSSPLREHRFLGMADSTGCISSFLIATPRQIRGFRAWDIVESFTAQSDFGELHALMGELVKNPDLLPGGASIVTVAAFPSDQAWRDTPALLMREQKVCHFYLMPDRLRSVPKLTMMAEGDLGL